MFLFRAALGGRLGNQIFHLAALDKLCNSRRIGVLFGCSDLLRYFHWRRPGVYIANRGGWRLFPLLRKLSDYRLTSHCCEGRVETEYGLLHSGELVTQISGSLPLNVVEDAYLQSDAWVRDDFSRMLVFRESIAASVEHFRAERDIDWESAVCVHVRRGDYVDQDVLGAGSPALPSAYYREAIERLQERMSVSSLVFVTDDRDYVETEFADIPRKVVVSRSAIFDLCLISKCASCVMSASSFSWWGAMLGPKRVPPIAPQYWMGWRRRIIAPPKIISTVFDVIPVISESHSR